MTPAPARRRIAGSYLRAVVACGTVPVALAATGHLGPLRGLDEPAWWVLLVLAVIGEVRPVRYVWGKHNEEVSTATTFLFAALLLFGIPAAMVAYAAVQLVGCVRARRTVLVTAFNVSQDAIGVVLGGCAFEAIGPRALGSVDAVTLAAVPAFVVAAGTLFATNAILVGIAVALPQGSVVALLRDTIPPMLGLAAAELGLAPVVAVVADAHLWLVPLLGVPMIAVSKGARASADNQYHALHDGLTGLPNRAFLHDRIEEAIAAAGGRGDGEQVAVLMIDLDGFKEVNDTLGHHVGDLLLRAVAARLQETAGTGVNIARLGGDEFAAVLPLALRSEAEQFAERMTVALEAPFVVGDIRLDIEGSIGIALYPEHAGGRDELLQHADVAMYRAKQMRTRVETYDPEEDPSSPRRLALLGELRHAIPNGELVLHYQPKIDLRSLAVVGVEALVRWHHPERGFTPPDEFIPLAERTGLITPLTQWVTDAALAQQREWRRVGLDVGVAVNVSVRNLHDADFAERVAETLDLYDVPPSRLKLEITEGTLMADPRRVVEVLERLHRTGITLSLDDFGTGYSSLAYLKRLPVRELKIDRSFVMHMTEDPDDSAIVRTTIDLARSLGLHVVAEGVENQDALELLAMFGCHHAQGFYISRPLTADAATAFLLDTTRHTTARHAGADPRGGLVVPGGG